jgi:hypothetical protein
MHAVVLADFAASLALHGPALLHRTCRLPSGPIQQYWTASRSRATHWHQQLARYRELEVINDLKALRQWWARRLCTLEEILVSEILARVVAALATGLESSGIDPDTAPIAQSVFDAQQEARSRVLHLMLHGRGSSVELLVRLNRVRTASERWSDLLVGHVATYWPQSIQFAVDPRRAAQHADEARLAEGGPSASLACMLTPLAIHDSLIAKTVPETANPRLNELIGQAILACLRPELFDSLGVLQSLWLHRLNSLSDQTERVVDQLIRPGPLKHDPLINSYEAIRGKKLQP